MINKAYIHEYGNNKLEPEHRDVIDVLKKRGIAYELFTHKKLSRNQLILDRHTLAVGDNPTIATILKRIGYSAATDCYPACLEKYSGRKIWTTTVRKLLLENSGGEMDIFVKPAARAKLFTGFVLRSGYDMLKLESFSKDTELYCSTLVDWVAEYRVFVTHGKIVGIKKYVGDESGQPDMKIIEQSVQDFENSKERTAAYGIDFGVLANGDTTLVEWNDGFALGSYGLDKELYTDLLIARWEEISAKVYSELPL